MNGTQSKMARAAFGLSAQQLADLAGVGRSTVVRFEDGENVELDTQMKIVAAFEAKGAKFTSREARVTVSVPEIPAKKV
jgi:DNA-binding XRE family transcriptional regulator